MATKKKKTVKKKPRKANKINTNFLKNLEEVSVKKGGNVSQICKVLKISRYTFYYHYKKDNKFKQIYDDACEEIVDFAESALIKKVNEGSNRAIEFFLTNKRSKNWKHRRTDTIENDDKSPIHVLIDQRKSKLLTEKQKKEAIDKAYKDIGLKSSETK